MNNRLVLALAVLALIFGAASAVADTIEFTSSGAGTYTFPGTLGSALSGTSTGVSVKQILPLTGAPVGLAGATLNFTSGPATAFGTYDRFAGGGTISISGGACGTGCFLGTFTGFQLDVANSIFSGAFVAGTVSPAVWGMVGLSPISSDATGSLTVNLIPTSSGGGQIGSADFSITRLPEPSSFALLTGSLLLAGGVARRKFAL